MNRQTNPFKSASAKFQPNGVYFGIIKGVDGRRLEVAVPRLTGTAVFPNVEFADGDFTTAPQVGERVFVTFKEGRQNDLVILGRMSSSLSTAYVDPSGAVTGDLLRYDGTSWVPDTIGIDDLNDVVITDPEEFQTLEFNGTNWQNAYSSVVTYARNVDTVTLPTGTCVYLFGATGDHATVKRADNSLESTSSKTVGVVGAPIAVNGNGPIITLGYVDGINLSSGYSPGDQLWLGTNGAFTKTKPSSPKHLVFIGVAVRCNANGIVYVKAQNGYELDEMHDVSIISPTSGDVLRYNGTLWINDPIDLLSDTVGNYVATVAGTANQISVSGSGVEGAAVTLSLPSPMTVPGNLNVTGNLIVNGTTTTVNSTTVTIDDPIFTLGGDTAPTVDDNKDRGIEFRYHNGTAAKLGFFGFDDSTGKFTFVTDATNTSEVFSGTMGEVDAKVDWSNLINPANYVSSISSGTGVTVTGTPAPGATLTVAIDQSVATSATPSFSSLTLTQTTGTAPLTVSSTTQVNNLNAQYLNGQLGSWYAPPGMLVPYAGSTAPSGWLLCYGQTELIASYPNLHAAIGTTYGGNGTTTFGIPDLRGRVALAIDNMGGTDANRVSMTNALGTAGGEETHQITANELPTHTHANTLNNAGVATSNHTHTEGTLQAAAGAVNNDAGSLWYNSQNPRVGGRGPTTSGAYNLYGMNNNSFSYNINHWTGVYGYTDGPNSTATVGITNGNNTTTATKMNVLQPYIVLNYIIKI